MRLLNALRTVDRAAGGPVEAVIQSARVLKSMGHTFDVVSLDRADDSFVRDFPGHVTAVGPGLGQYGYASEFVPWLRRNAKLYDAILVHGVWDYNCFGVWQALRASDKPYFVYTHGMLDPWFKRTYPLKHLKKWLYWPWATYRALRDARGVVFTTEDERKLARESFWLYRCRELVIHYGTSESRGDATLEHQAFLSRYPALRDKRIVLFLGRIHVKKGCDLLIKAFAKIAERDPRLQLVMAGPDKTGEQDRLEAIAKSLNIQNRITWTGMLSGDVKWGAFRAADVFALTSHQENFGVAVAEALACGLPVLITDKVNVWREIQADGAGFIANDDLGGAQELLEKWESLNELERQRMRKNARECFKTRFEITQSVESLVQVLRDNGIAG
jgi:glycosyltransferase involved in cell wall biosynthesis